MNFFITARDRIRIIYSRNEVNANRVLHGIIVFIALLVINNNFGYQKFLDKTFICLLLALGCAFLPMSGITAIIGLFLLIHLFTLSTEVGITALVIIAVSLLLCAYFKSKNTYNIFFLPVCYQVGIPYAIPLGAGLLRNINELASVVCGGVFSYFLYVIKSNVSGILDAKNAVSCGSLIMEQMLKSRLFYMYIVALVVMFIVVYYIRTAKIKMAWLYATGAGVISEFIIMLAGLLLSGNKGDIPKLLIGNIVIAFVGVVINYIFFDLNYGRIEKVQFEDDDYYYYVTAVPKIKIVEEKKRVKRI